MKKRYFLFLFILVLLFSCKKKEEPPVIDNSYARGFARELFLYEYTRNTENPHNRVYLNKIKMNDSLKKLLETKVVYDGQFGYLLEKIIPDFAGIIDAKGFYNGETDTGRWVDNVMFTIQEELIGMQINEMLEMNPAIEEVLTEQNQKRITEGDEDFETPDQDSEKLLWDSQRRLKIMEYQSEIFVPQFKNDKKVYVHADGRRVFRCFYDEYFRLEKREDWDIPDAKNATLLYTESYTYQGKTRLLTEKVVKRSKEEIYSFFNKEGRLYKADVYWEVEVDGKKTMELKSTTEWTYDKKGNITGETTTQYGMEDEIKEEDEVPDEIEEEFDEYYNYYDEDEEPEVIVKSQAFIYNKEDETIPPDYEYYENGDLRSQTIYTDRETYYIQVFFDNNFMVTSYYEHGVKVKDVYMSDGVIRRTKTYE